jgi:four helix bundle protein
MENKIKSFTDLHAWKKSHALVLEIYSITKKFPKDELFGLTNQMRRCAVSISSNVAEGFSRHSYKEKTQFYSVSQGSVTELQNQLLIARDVKYIPNNVFQLLAAETIIIHKLLTGLIKHSITMIHNS